VTRPSLFILSVVAATFPPLATAEAQVRSAGTVLMAETPRARESQEKWGYSDAVIAGDTVYLSGLVAGQARGETNLEAAYERVYQRAAAILKRAGASWDDVVEITSFHTDVEAQIDAMAAVHKRHVKAPFAAWTAIGVARLLGGGITEIKITARRPAAASRP
jgi:enamine deaminase RidA (YjgF/YER057c/UK114 family)